MSYKDLEDKLVGQLRTLLIYGDGNCVADRVDAAFKYSDESDFDTNDHTFVSYVDYAGGTRGETRGMWTHQATLMVAVRIEGNADDTGENLRTAVELVRSLLYPNNTNVASRCQLTNIQPPLVMERGSGMWWVCFMMVEMDEEMARC